MRRPHLLARNKSNEMPHEAVWLDTETFPEKMPDGSERHHLEFGYAAYSRTRGKDDWIEPEWLRFTTLEQLWEWIFSRLHGKSRLYIFAHNWAFDAPVIDVFNRLPAEGWKLKGSVINSPPVILRWRKAPHTLQFVDTLNIWRMPLAKLGDSIGLPKLEMPPRGASREEWDTYAHRDVEIIMQACFRWWTFLKENDLGGFASTLASQAIRTYRHRFMKHEILIDDNEAALNLARRALHGGRTECFYLGEVSATVYKLDINSQYPAVMRSRLMPTRLIGHYKRISLDELQAWLKTYCITATVTIETEQAVFPVVHDERLVFPVGKYVTSLSTPELVYALKHKLIKRVHECAIYERGILFKGYIEWFYKYRQECREKGNEVDALNAKLMMNSLYGKFAQRGLIYNKTGETDDLSIKVWTEVDSETGTVYHHRQYAGITEELQHETESRDSHPAIAGHITAYARMHLWRLMQLAGPGNFYYCDTDSLWTNREGYERLERELSETDLGKLKLEDVSDAVTLYGAKDYIVDGNARTKGIRKKARKINDNTFEQDKFTTLIGLLRKGDMTAPVVEKVTKRLKREYKKGVVHDSGLVTPLRLPLEGE